MNKLTLLLLPALCVFASAIAFAGESAETDFDVEKVREAIRQAGLLDGADADVDADAEPAAEQADADAAGFEKAIAKLRRSQISVNYENVPLQDVLAELQKVSGVNLVLDPNIQAQRGEISVKLKLENVMPVSVLRLVLTMYDLMAVYGDEAFLVSLPKQEEPITLVYDVHELTVLRSFSFPSRKIMRGLEPRYDDRFYLRPQWMIDEEREEAQGKPRYDADKLIEMLKAATPNGDWEDDRYSITHESGILLITQRPEVQVELAKILIALKTR